MNDKTFQRLVLDALRVIMLYLLTKSTSKQFSYYISDWLDRYDIYLAQITIEGGSKND